MNKGIIPVIIFFITFLVSLYSATKVPEVTWLSDSWIAGSVVFGILQSFAAFLLACFVYSDYNANQEASSFWRRKYARSRVSWKPRSVKSTCALEE
jgi:hypothetical protein